MEVITARSLVSNLQEQEVITEPHETPVPENLVSRDIDGSKVEPIMQDAQGSCLNVVTLIARGLEQMYQNQSYSLEAIPGVKLCKKICEGTTILHGTSKSGYKCSIDRFASGPRNQNTRCPVYVNDASIESTI